jgi:Protease inhibitor Inh
MRFTMRPTVWMRRLALATLLGAAGGCSGERGGFGGIAPPAGSTPGHVATGPRPGSTAPVNMTGRWVLATPNAGFCNMTFAGAPGAAEGTIAPEGGCPGSFFTSRKWAFEPSGLIIRNHNGEPLAQLSSTDQGRLEGQATSGESVTLTR